MKNVYLVIEKMTKILLLFYKPKSICDYELKFLFNMYDKINISLCIIMWTGADWLKYLQVLMSIYCMCVSMFVWYNMKIKKLL